MEEGGSGGYREQINFSWVGQLEVEKIGISMSKERFLAKKALRYFSKFCDIRICDARTKWTK